jgi:hypothetical protein
MTWLGYVGVITGGIGALTGICGAIMGYIGYRNSRSMKALDLRLQLRKDESDFRACVESLPALLELAKQSQCRLLVRGGLRPRLSRMRGQPARPVLRGARASNGSRLLDDPFHGEEAVYAAKARRRPLKSEHGVLRSTAQGNHVFGSNKASYSGRALAVQPTPIDLS